MSNAKTRKLQYLLIKQLLEVGTVELNLPDGIVLEIGILQEDKNGEMKKSEDYCYVVATRENKSTMLDSFNLGVSYESDDSSIVCESEILDNSGNKIKILDVV